MGKYWALWFLGATVVGLWLLFSSGGNSPPSPVLVINDFESDPDLDRVGWHCHTLMARSAQHPANGDASLELILYPATYAGLAIQLEVNDWSRYQYLVFDIFNPQQEIFAITVRIDDQPDYPPFEERFQGRFSLLPGANQIRIPLNELYTSGDGRPLDLEKIARFMWFIRNTAERYTLYFDYVRLER